MLGEERRKISKTSRGTGDTVRLRMPVAREKWRHRLSRYRWLLSKGPAKVKGN